MSELTRLCRRKSALPEIVYADDVERLRGILERAGYTATDHDIAWAWGEESDTLSASWLILYREDEHNLETLLRYLEPCPDAMADNGPRAESGKQEER